jgi:GNAT superfamily N-acetyltransferase
VLTVRRLTEEDVLSCLEIDPGYGTRSAWKLERREVKDDVIFRLSPIELPRERLVDGFPHEPPFDQQVASSDFALMLEDHSVLGYVLAKEEAGETRLGQLVVGTVHRRKGHGGRLLTEVKDWSKQNGIRSIFAVLEARNFPGICFLRAKGFRVRGIQDSFGRANEVTVQLSAPVQ